MPGEGNKGTQLDMEQGPHCVPGWALSQQMEGQEITQPQGGEKITGWKKSKKSREQGRLLGQPFFIALLCWWRVKPSSPVREAGTLKCRVVLGCRVLWELNGVSFTSPL